MGRHLCQNYYVFSIIYIYCTLFIIPLQICISTMCLKVSSLFIYPLIIYKHKIRVYNYKLCVYKYKARVYINLLPYF